EFAVAEAAWNRRCFRFVEKRTADPGDPEAMRLFRTAVWLGVTIYCLPSTNSHPTAPQPSPNSSQCQFHNAADIGRLCARHLGSDADRPRLVVKRSERRKEGSSRQAAIQSQNTLTRSDLTVPWHGSAVGKESEARRAI